MVGEHAELTGSRNSQEVFLCSTPPYIAAHQLLPGGGGQKWLIQGPEAGLGLRALPCHHSRPP